MKGVAVITLLVVLSVVFARPSEAAINCSQVSGALAPCVSFLTQGGNPTPQCCTGLKNLVNMASTQQDRRAACNCVKSAAARYPIKQDAASNLPGRCGVSMNIPISPNTNCNTYLFFLLLSFL